MQTQYLKTLLATASEWGLTIDSESQPFGNAGEASYNMVLWARYKISFLYPRGESAWTLFASAFVSDTTVRDTLIGNIYNHANSNVSNGIFPERYDTRDNSWRNGVAG